MQKIADVICRRHFGPNAKLVFFSHSQDYVYKIYCEDNQYILKFINNNPLFGMINEKINYNVLTGSSYIKNILYQNEDNTEPEYLITEMIEGRILNDLIVDGIMTLDLYDSAGKMITSLINECYELGKTSELLHKPNCDWQDYMIQLFKSHEKLVSQLPIHTNKELLEDIYYKLNYFFKQNFESFSFRPYSYIPADMNMKNFLLMTDGSWKMIDLGGFMLADRLFGIGEIFAHIYDTPLMESFLENMPIFSPAEMNLIHFYAAFCSYSIMIFVAKFNIDIINALKPYGHHACFIDLIDSHFRSVENYGKGYFGLNSSFVSDEIIYRKVSRFSERVVKPYETIKRFKNYKGLGGITRVSEITALDSMQIPAFQSVRPNAEKSEGTFSIFSGKGRTSEECKIGAIAEGIERYCAERNNFDETKICRGSMKSLLGMPLIPPSDFTLPKDCGYSENNELEWVQAVSLINGKTYYIPADAVFYPYTPPKGITPLFRYYTTGLAAGNTYEEALLHGISEVIERDAAALNLILKRSPAVDLSTIKEPIIQELIIKIKSSGVIPIVRCITSPDLPIPVFSVIFDDPNSEDLMMISGGYCAAANKDFALLTALNEAVLSRVTTISGAREDLKKFEDYKRNYTYKEYKQKYSYWFNTTYSINYDEIIGYRSLSIQEDTVYLIDCIKKAGFENIYVINLTNNDINLPVVKVIIPGMERYSWNCNYGKRAKQLFRKYVLSK